VDVETYETMGDIIGICTANSRTTDNRVVGRSHVPFSLLDTSIQLCPSVQLRVRCKAERTFFVEEDNLYKDFKEQRRFCPRTVVNGYFAFNPTIQTCDKLKKIMSDASTMAPHSALPKLHRTGRYVNCCHCVSYHAVIPSRLPSVSTVSVSWIWWRHMMRLYNTLLPGLGLFAASCNFPYAQFLMACFQHTSSRGAAYSLRCLSHPCFQSSACHSCYYSTGSMSTQYKLVVNYCHSSAQHHCETETTGGNSSSVNDFGDVLRSDFNTVGDFEVVQYRNANVKVTCNKNPENMPLQCSEIIPNHMNTARLSSSAAEESDEDDSDSEDGAQSQTKDTVVAHSAGTTSFLAASSCADKKQNGCWSFFIRASDSDASDDLDSDDDDDDDDSDAASDESDNCWEDNDEDGDADADNSLTHCTRASQCFLIDLDPLKINGLYIPPTSTVPVSQSRCRSLPFDSPPLLDSAAAEVESESMRTLRRINDAWQLCYNGDDVRMKSSSLQHHMKHVCVF